MSGKLIAPDRVQIGDKILVNNQIWSINYKSEPDYRGTIDYYLVNDSGAYHFVSAEPITIIR